MKNIFYNFIQSLSKRQKRGFITGIICIISLLILVLYTKVLGDRLYDQQAYQRWSDDGGVAQISCFYPITMEGLDDYYFLNLEHNMEQSLNDASIQASSQNGKLFTDTLSVTGTIDIKSDYGTATIKAVGVMNDFFIFHPVELLDGNYIGGDMLMQDGIIIDEDAAWQLFGSSDIVGMKVMISGVPYYIAGVAKRADGHFEESAGLSESVCYVSLSTLKQYGIIDAGYTYEITMPNPVNDFAMKAVNDALKDEDKKIDVIENSKRYQFYPLLIDLKDFGIRSMSRKGIVYPYWENIARGYEDLFALLILIKIILVLIPSILLITYLYGRWKVKTWTWKEIVLYLFEKIKCFFTFIWNIMKRVLRGKKEKKHDKD